MIPDTCDAGITSSQSNNACLESKVDKKFWSLSTQSDLDRADVHDEANRIMDSKLLHLNLWQCDTIKNVITLL